MMPLSGGLINAGGQATVPEPSWWEARNCTVGSDGRLSKRPGITQWGQTIKAPTPGGAALGVAWQEIFTDESHLNMVNTPNATVVTQVGLATFSTTNLVESSNVGSITRFNQPQDGTIATGEAGKMDFRFMFRALDLPVPSSFTNWRGFGGGFEDEAGVSVGFLIGAAGIYIQNAGTFTLVAGTDIDNGAWHVVEMRKTSSSSVSIYIDGGAALTATYSDSATFDPAGTNQAILGVSPNANGTIHAEVALMQGRSGNGNIVGVPIDHTYEWNSIEPQTRHFLAVARDTIYDDRDWSSVFLPIATTDPGDLTTFSPFQAGLVFANGQTGARFWTGATGSAPVEIATPMPRNVYLTTQHQGRCVAVRRDSPLNVYVSAANSLEDWTTEDSVSASGESFFLPLPDAAGVRVTALVGDFYGQLVIFTETSVYTLAGTDVDTYTLRLITAKLGCTGPRAVARAGNDLVFMSQYGAHSFNTVKEYGDVSTAYLTKNLRNLWQRNALFGLPKVINNYRSSVVHAPHLARTYLALQTQEDAFPSRIYELNHDNNEWAGPWTVECYSANFALVSHPGVPTLIVTDSDGRVGLVRDQRKLDYETDGYEFRMRSARFDGRSLDPALIRRTKLWRALRLYVVPRGDWEIAVSWTADGDTGPDDHDAMSQNVYESALLSSTFVLDVSETEPAEKIGVITIPLDARSRWIEFKITQAGTNEDAIIVGIEVDLVPAQDDKENV
jgi:hypothetical protein